VGVRAAFDGIAVEFSLLLRPPRRFEVTRMKRRFSGEFKIVLSVSVLILLGVGAVLLSEATKTVPRVEMVSPSVKMTQDLEYGRVDDLSLRLDVYQPRTASISLRPALLLIHGGGWVEGDKSGERDLASILVPKGFVAFAINYRLALDDKARYPAAALDVRRAARWVRVHAREYGADPTRLAAVGLSAGGHLAALLGTTDVVDSADPNSTRASSRVACVVDTAGPTDFTDANNPAVGPKIARVIPDFFGRSLDEIPQAYREASPNHHVDSKSAPTLIVHGTVDDIVPIDQSRRFHQSLQKAGVETRLVELEGEGHGFLQPENQKRWLDEMADFLVGHLKP